MNISLTPRLEKMVHEKVRSGKYSSASEVIREALREELRCEEARRRAQIDDLRTELGLGLADVGAGRYGPLDIEALKNELRRRRARKTKKGAR